MTAVIEITLRDHDPDFWTMLGILSVEQNCPVHFEESYPPTETVYTVTLGKSCWKRWEDRILAYAKDHLQYMMVEFDRSGDDEDESMRVTWDGERFTFDYWRKV